MADDETANRSRKSRSERASYGRIRMRILLPVFFFAFVELGNAQTGTDLTSYLEDLEKDNGLYKKIGLYQVSQYGRQFTILSLWVDGDPNDKKENLYSLELEFIGLECVYARHICRKRKFPTYAKDKLWKLNFDDEKVVRKEEDKWVAGNGGKLMWVDREDGGEAIIIISAKMDKIMRDEAIRLTEKELGRPLSPEVKSGRYSSTKTNSEQKEGFRITFGGRGEDTQIRQVYDTDSRWVGTIRNGQIYGTDSTWKGSVRNGQVYNTDSTWSGSINNNGQIYNTDSDWKGNAR